MCKIRRLTYVMIKREMPGRLFIHNTNGCTRYIHFYFAYISLFLLLVFFVFLKSSSLLFFYTVNCTPDNLYLRIWKLSQTQNETFYGFFSSSLVSFLSAVFSECCFLFHHVTPPPSPIIQPFHLSDN